MSRPTLIAVIVAGIAVLIGAGLVFGTGDNSPDDNEATATATSTSTAAATQTPPPTATPAADSSSAIPSWEVQDLLEQLPAVVRERVREQLLRGDITPADLKELVEQRDAAAQFGVITAIEDNRIEISTPEGTTYDWEITTDTAIKTGATFTASVSDLAVGESVFVLSRDGKTAFSIESYGVLPLP